MNTPKNGSVVGALTLMGVFLSFSAAADAVWKDGVTVGSWTNAENWVDGILPGATTPATLTRSGADYRVTVESDTTLYATNTTLGNANGTTRLDIYSPMTFFRNVGSQKTGSMFFKQGAGVETTVWTNGAIRFEGPWSNGGGDAGRDTEAFSIGGSRFTVDGGTVDLHTSRTANLRGTSAAPTELVVTNGGYFAWHTEKAEYTYGQFRLNQYTKIRVHDGAFCINRMGNQYGNPIYDMTGGEMLFTGTSVFSNGFGSAAASVQNLPMELNGGSLTFRDRSELRIAQRDFQIGLRPKTKGGRVSLSLLDSSLVAARLNYLYLCDINSDGVDDIRADMTVETDRTETMSSSMFIVGLGTGTGELTWKRGNLTAAFYGLFVGRASDSDLAWNYQHTNPRLTWDASAHACTGLVSFAAGNLRIEAQANDPAYKSSHFSGLIVGDGLAITKADFAVRPVCGRFDFSGGTLTNANGRILVGLGRATGRFIQTGGEVWKGYSSTQYGPDWGNNGPCGIGLAGGDGWYCVSNGTTRMYNTLYVGGATTNDMIYGILKSAHNPFGRYTDAVGRLTVAGTGRFYQMSHETSKGEILGVWLGRDGDGTLEICGSQATCELQNSLVMTNGYRNADGELLTHGRATVRFVADATATGLKALKVTQRLYIAPNARLEVDLTDYAGPNRKVIKIIDCASRTGAFAPENVTLKRCRLVTKPGDPDIYVQAYWKQGLAVMVR